VRVLLGREDVVRLGPKRPPVAGGARADGTGVLRVVRTPGIAEAIATVAPGLVVEEVDVAGPPTSLALRAAGWAEAVVLLAGARGTAGPVTDPLTGAVAEAAIDAGGSVRVRVAGGAPLDEVVLRSYATGAAHMALSWVSSEGIAVDEDGVVHDLTIRSFGILRAVDTPPIEVTVEPGDGPPLRSSDAVFAAVAAAAWLHAGVPTDWPTGTRWR
jgi:CO/xanthine dehydrogenase Mo-binding subunit